jgi:hypothetical protein
MPSEPNRKRKRLRRDSNMDNEMQYKGFIIHPVSILLEMGRYGLRVDIFENEGGQIAPHHIPTFEETFETREEAIEFGLAEGKKLIDSGQLSRPTN